MANRRPYLGSRTTRMLGGTLALGLLSLGCQRTRRGSSARMTCHCTPNDKYVCLHNTMRHRRGRIVREQPPT
ncbi:hypothetical protein L208DRAFT_1413986 [Tricholoma matsutake]|nr:hypothetical protein L208DRAFT_1413986 [Tricholoma matsutake 945]